MSKIIAYINANAKYDIERLEDWLMATKEKIPEAKYIF